MSIRPVLQKIFGAPWVVFLLLGGLAYAIFPNSVEQPLIHVTRSQFDSYLDSYLRQFPAPDSPGLEQRLLDQLIAEEVLLQQALSMGYQYLPVVQDRLKKLGGFLGEDSAEPAADEVLIARAVDLGLLESDPVIRRYLVSVMERALVAAVAIDISEQEVEAYYQQHVSEFVQPPRLDLTHVYFSEDGGRSREAAAAVGQGLAAPVAADLDQVLSAGDVFYSGHQFVGNNEAQLAAIFGVDFARDVFQARAAQWSPPLHSAYGWHLVWPENIQPSVTPPLPQVRDKILSRIRLDKEKLVFEEQLEKLKLRYQVVVDVDVDVDVESTPGAAS